MKSGEPSPLYLFRSQGFAASGDTVVSVVPQQHVVAVYGGGGTFEADGLSQAFGGAAIFRNDATGRRTLTTIILVPARLRGRRTGSR